MKQEKGRTFNNISKGVKSTRSKLKQTTIATPIKNAPLTAKVNSTWNNVLNKNKGCAIGKISTANKFEINLATNDPLKTMGLLIMELKNKMDTLLPGNRALKNIVGNILQTFSKMEQSFEIQNSLKKSVPVKSQFTNQQSSSIDTNELHVGFLRQMNEDLDAKLKERMEENFKLQKENEDKESQLLILKTELDSTVQRIEKLESTLNECVNTERETIANYEQQCKRLQNEIKTLQDSASQKRSRTDHSTEIENKKSDRMIAVDKFKSQIQMALKELEMEKLMTILKYDENQMMASYSEFCDVYDLIQKYFTSDHSQQMQIVFNAHQSDEKK